ncbi:unnamed protein product [Tuber melanosporum]|uniref:(Perigord truffle) hypothetical protein n=1 Tax=Tuber melanosporum (strain Mel28) TaxID=656061 RepID=D5G9Z8_TUBMM|nr:uncharacterized protein GSTUM_00003471001 [Tuber melanosporum]CAZ81341.1 unnamed protein product [Tuber melanosporum]
MDFTRIRTYVIGTLPSAQSVASVSLKESVLLLASCCCCGLSVHIRVSYLRIPIEERIQNENAILDDEE